MVGRTLAFVGRAPALVSRALASMLLILPSFVAGLIPFDVRLRLRWIERHSVRRVFSNLTGRSSLSRLGDDLGIELRELIGLRGSVILAEFIKGLRHNRRSGKFYLGWHEFRVTSFGGGTEFSVFPPLSFRAEFLDILPMLSELVSL